MISYMLVFWIATPTNFVEHNKYQSEQECRQAAVVWNQRLQQVKSKMIAECRS